MTNLEDLPELIELNLGLAWNSPSEYAREQCKALATHYAKEYAEKTGIYYKRVAQSLGKTIQEKIE